MQDLYKGFVVDQNAGIMDALKKIDNNKQGFVIVTDSEGVVRGVLTDGDIRRGLIGGKPVSARVCDFYTKEATTVPVTDGLNRIIDLFKDERIKFAPIVDSKGTLVNLITKAQLHTLLLQDIHADLSYDFCSLDSTLIDQEIYQRPWGYYKTTVLNDYYQGKVISVRPGGQLSLQAHHHREEHWIVVHGRGTVQLDDSVFEVRCGSTVFIPKGCRHRLTNTDGIENLIVTEVQLGDYFGEDDIIRYEDIYHRDST